MDINTNVAAQTAATDLNQSTNMLNASLARLSSGSKLVNPSDNPAGLAESLFLVAEVNQTSAANQNVSNAVSFLQTQNGYMQQVGSALDQMAQLAVQSQDVTLTDAQRSDYQQEFSTLAGYINDTSSKTFNGVSLFSGAALSVTTDGDGGTFSMAGVDIGGASTAYAAVTANTVSVGTTTGAVAALTLVQAAISQLGTDSATVGANQQRLNYTNSELGVLKNNLSAANSQITDVDVAAESTNFAKEQILVQSGVSMLAQANASAQAALKLLG